jgi:hypothetical protein
LGRQVSDLAKSKSGIRRLTVYFSASESRDNNSFFFHFAQGIHDFSGIKFCLFRNCRDRSFFSANDIIERRRRGRTKPWGQIEGTSSIEMAAQVECIALTASCPPAAFPNIKGTSSFLQNISDFGYVIVIVSHGHRLRIPVP